MPEKKEEDDQKKNVPVNVATGYGLEDHEATQQDPRVHELRRVDSKHAATPQQQKTSMQPQRKVVTSTTSKTPEDKKTSTPQESDTPAQSEEPRRGTFIDTEQKSSSSSPAATPNPTQQKKLNVTPVVTPAQAPTRAPTVDRNGPQEVRKKPTRVNKLINTDVTFDPSKEFASKSTNTAGGMYSELSEEEYAPPIAPIRMTKTLFADEYDDIFAFAVALVKKAGAFAIETTNMRSSQGNSMKDSGLPTNNEVENMLVVAINGKYPLHKIIAEGEVSRSKTGEVFLSDKPTWILHPIDGAMNFAHHFPYYCISVAFLVNKDTVFGIVFNPRLEELYTAQKGKGAKLNDKPMEASNQQELKNSMILHEYSDDKSVDQTLSTNTMENNKRLIPKTHALRSIGSSAMALAMVASGVADGFYIFGLHVWDMAAGNLLVTEAGGTVIDPAGGAVDIMSRRVLAAATRTLALQLADELIQSYPKPRDDEPRIAMDTQKKDFNAQTDFSDSSLSFSSDDTEKSSRK